MDYPNAPLKPCGRFYARYPQIEKVVVYGSRAMGNYRTGSDIDLTMYGEYTDSITYHNLLRIAGELDDSDIPYMVDLSIFDALDHAKLRDHIERVGQVFYEHKAALDWKTVKLGDVATIIAGQSPTGENYNTEGQGMPFYQGKKNYGDKFLKSPTVWTKSVTKVAIEGDVLMSVRDPVGAINIVTQEICIGRGLAAIRVHTEIDKDYLFYSLAQISDGLTGSSGAVFNSINKKQIESIEFLLPPNLPVQKQIVEKLDAAFADIDRAMNATKKKTVEFDSIKILNS